MEKSTKLTHYSSPFSPAYWRGALETFRSTRMLVLAAMFVAIEVIIGSFYIRVVPFGLGNVRVYFTFFVVALAAYIYGPILGSVAAVVADCIGAMLAGEGFYPGYTLTAVLTALVFALFLFRARVTVFRLFVAKLIGNIFINIGLNALWDIVYYGKSGYLGMLALRLPKNLVLLPFEVLALVLFFQLMLPILPRFGLAPKQSSKRIPLI